MAGVTKDAERLWVEIKMHNPLGLAQAILYLLSVIWAFFVCVPMGITLRNFDGRCIMYAELVWGNTQIWPWSETSCDFTLYFTIAACMVYAIFMAIFTLLAILPRTTKDPDRYGLIQSHNSRFLIKATNPVLLIINLAISALCLCSAVIITVGFARFCRDLETKLDIGTCYDAQAIDWANLRIVGGMHKGVRGDSFHICLTIATIGAWALFIVWILQLCLNFSLVCIGCSCAKAEEKQKMSNSMYRAQQRSRMTTPGNMTPQYPPQGPPQGRSGPPSMAGRGPAPQMMAQAHMGPNPHVTLGPVPHKSTSSSMA
jgi:hypothetical protein